jgi:hypothetical protein
MVLQARLTDIYYSNGIYNTFKKARKSERDLFKKLDGTKFTSGPDTGKSMLDDNYTDEAVQAVAILPGIVPSEAERDCWKA